MKKKKTKNLKKNISDSLRDTLAGITTDDFNKLNMKKFDNFINSLVKLIAEKNGVLRTLKEDARMALSGEWNVAENATDESKEGFQYQIQVIDGVIDNKF